MIERHYLDDCLLQLRKLKSLADKAIAQIDDEHPLRRTRSRGEQHRAPHEARGVNMRSRWTDFLTSDGEKPDRNRDTEFELAPDDTRARILERWEDGWNRVFHAVS